MENLTYEKPCLTVMPSQWASWCKKAIVADSALLNLPWGKIEQKETISKTIEMEAPIEKIWEIVSNPKNYQKLLSDVSAVEIKGENYSMTYTSFNPREGWQTVTWDTTLLKKERPNLLVYSFEPRNPRPLGNYTGTVTYSLKKLSDNATSFTVSLEYNAKIAEHEYEELELEQYIRGVYKEAVGEKRFSEVCEKYRALLPKSRIL